MASVAITRLFCRAQISIAPPARPRATSRGFVPWRLSAAGPSLGVPGPVRHRPASETLHSSGHMTAKYAMVAPSRAVSVKASDAYVGRQEVHILVLLGLRV